MKKDDESPPAPSDQVPEQPAPETPWLTERLTEAEIEALRQDQNEASTYLQKVFPKARIHRAGNDFPEEPKG